MDDLMKPEAFPGHSFFHLASTRLSQVESTRVLARDLQNVLLTGKTQNGSKSEEIIQRRLPWMMASGLQLALKWVERHLLHSKYGTLSMIRELNSTAAKPHSQTWPPHQLTLDEVACSE